MSISIFIIISPTTGVSIPRFPYCGVDPHGWQQNCKLLSATFQFMCVGLENIILVYQNQPTNHVSVNMDLSATGDAPVYSHYMSLQRMIMVRSSTTNHCASSTCRRILSGSIRWMTLHLGALGLRLEGGNARRNAVEDASWYSGAAMSWIRKKNWAIQPASVFRTAYRGCSAGKHRRAVAGAQVATGGASKLEHSVSAP